MPATSRRRFIYQSSLLAGLFSIRKIASAAEPTSFSSSGPIVLSTWSHGIPANAAAWEILSKGGRSLDAVEAGVRIPEAGPNVTSVGLGGYPDRDGRVTLDACIMDEYSNCGSVAFPPKPIS